MRAVKSTGTGPERRVYDILRRNGLQTASQVAGLPGKPDFILKGQDVAVLVEGCFWHGCPRHYKEPKSNVAFWRAKVAANKRRDARSRRRLRELGYGVVRVWECKTRTPEDLQEVVRRVARESMRLWRWH